MTKKNEDKTELVWRLKSVPNAHEVTDLVKSEIITKDEAREILFSKREPKDEIKQLKKEVELLSQLIRNSLQPAQVNHLDAIVQGDFVNDLWATWFKQGPQFLN